MLTNLDIRTMCQIRNGLRLCLIIIISMISLFFGSQLFNGFQNRHLSVSPNSHTNDWEFRVFGYQQKFTYTFNHQKSPLFISPWALIWDRNIFFANREIISSGKKIFAHRFRWSSPFKRSEYFSSQNSRTITIFSDTKSMKNILQPQKLNSLHHRSRFTNKWT